MKSPENLKKSPTFFDITVKLGDKERFDKKQIEIRQSKINSSWVAGPIGQMNRRPSV